MLEPLLGIAKVIVFKRSAAVIRREQVFIGCNSIAVTYGLARCAVQKLVDSFPGRSTVSIYLFVLQVAAIIILEYCGVAADDIFTNKPVQPVVFI